jgi:hypothetical protein
MRNYTFCKFCACKVKLHSSNKYYFCNNCDFYLSPCKKCKFVTYIHNNGKETKISCDKCNPPAIINFGRGHKQKCIYKYIIGPKKDTLCKRKCVDDRVYCFQHYKQMKDLFEKFELQWEVINNVEREYNRDQDNNYNSEDLNEFDNDLFVISQNENDEIVDNTIQKLNELPSTTKEEQDKDHEYNIDGVIKFIGI